MILHFLSDDKFSDYVISQFSGPEMCSEFVLMSASEKTEYFENVRGVKVVNPFQKDSMNDLIHSLGDYSAVVLHGLFYPWCETVLRNVPDDVKVAWVFWGGEIYGRDDLKYTFLGPRSKMILRVREVRNKLQRNKKNDEGYVLPKESYQRIDYCLTDMQEEFDYAKRYLDASKMIHHWYNYYSIEETVGSLVDSRCDGDNIFVGNSSTIECNFFETFRMLKKIPLESRKIVVPLSYGSPWLRNLLLKYGKRRFGNGFNPLVTFMHREEYNTTMLSCSVMIQPQYRAQAQGNIITGLWLGMRVYLNEKNFAYSYFKRIGAIVFSIKKDLKKKNPKVFAPLTDEEVQHNRRVLEEVFSKDVMRMKNVELVKLLS